MNLLFNSDIGNLHLKINEGRRTRVSFVVFVVWGALIVDGWVVVTWSRKTCIEIAEIASFVFLVLFQDERRSVSPRFHLFFRDVD